MADDGVTIIVEMDRWAEVLAALDAGVEHAVEQGAIATVAAIQSVIEANGQVATGAMLHSVYYRTEKTSTYPGDGGGGADLLAEVDAPGHHEAAISVAADYAVYQNYGTRYQPARPFMEPGTLDAVPAIDNAFADMEGVIRDGGFSE